MLWLFAQRTARPNRQKGLHRSSLFFTRPLLRVRVVARHFLHVLAWCRSILGDSETLWLVTCSTVIGLARSATAVVERHFFAADGRASTQNGMTDGKRW